MDKGLTRVVLSGFVYVPLFACLFLTVLIGYRLASSIQVDMQAKGKLESALETIPVVSGDVLVQQASGKEYGGVIGCVSYHIEQVHGTNDLDISEVLNLYTNRLPSGGWKPGLVLSDARTFRSSDDVGVSISDIQEVYWYSLYPFGSPFSSQAMYPDKGIINQAKKRFRSVFTTSIVTFPPNDEECHQ